MISRTLAIVSAVLFIGTVYSVVYDSYLDTSNPLLTHLPHPLSKTHYFANKSNALNVYFIKKAWGWTTSAFLLLWFTSPPSYRTFGRLSKFLTLTAFWILFTGWFFGPALLERVIVATGGECVISLPGGQGPITVPHEFCYTKTTLGPDTHPQFFVSPSFTTSEAFPSTWSGVPRLRRGHDVSGHVFLLTMSTLFLADQLKVSLMIPKWDALHSWAVTFNLGIVFTWLLALWTTSVYFHSPFEKVTGFFLGLAAYGVTKLPIFPQTKPPLRAQRLSGSSRTD